MLARSLNVAVIGYRKFTMVSTCVRMAHVVTNVTTTMATAAVLWRCNFEEM